MSWSPIDTSGLMVEHAYVINRLGLIRNLSTQSVGEAKLRVKRPRRRENAALLREQGPSRNVLLSVCPHNRREEKWEQQRLRRST